MIENDLILRAARGISTERTPVWLMRQAGRILKEYREVRAGVGGFKELVENPEMAAEVTVQPVDILGVDAAIIFSDILVVPEAMGLPYEIKESVGPYFRKTISSSSDVIKLNVPNPEDKLHYVKEAIEITKGRLQNRVPLIGFAGAPWTIFSYMIEGGGSKTFSKARKMLYQNPTLSHQLLEKITQTTILYLKMQIKAGADMVQIFDSWAGILPKNQYETFGLKYIKEICDEINEVPVTVFAKGAWNTLDLQGNLSCNTIGIDWMVSADLARTLVGPDKTIQGNLDPCLLYAEDEVLVSETKKMLSSFGSRRHIANLGHGVYPDTNPEKVKLFINTVKDFKN
ncbi:MAG: uroporphyrinogen decarboxylase [Flavobacteriales bacterium]|nr:uroporphyrinogen decarboxylase [Flavobacteriales bacterium]